MNSDQIKESIWEFLETTLQLGPVGLVGIDIGTTSIKVAEMLDVGSGKFKLNRFGMLPIPYGSIVESEIMRPDAIKNAIISLFESMKISNKNVCIGLSGPNCLAKRMQVAGDTYEEITDHILWESEQYIPFGIDDAQVSFFIQGINEGGGNDCLMASCKNDLVESVTVLIEDCQLKVKVVDLDLISLGNVYLASIGIDKVNSNDGVILLDLGAQKTNMAVMQGDKIIFTREINLGGKNVTEEIQKGISLSYEEAQDLKCSIDNQGHGPEEVLKIIENCVAQFCMEIKKTIQFFGQTETDISMVQCFVTGGNSLLYGLIQALQEELDLPVEFLNPFQYFSINEKNIDEHNIQKITTLGTVAMGLGLRKIAKKQ